MADVSFLKACMDHLRLSGEPLAAFAAEIKKLTPKDREEMQAQFTKEFGYTITTDKT